MTTANVKEIAVAAVPTWGEIMDARWTLIAADRGDYHYTSDAFGGVLTIEFADANSEFTQDWAYVGWAIYRAADGEVAARWQRPNGRQWQA